MKPTFCLLALATTAPADAAGISFDAVFGSHMVLQQAPAKACVSGLLGAGGTSATIEISGAAAEVLAEVTPEGAWKACLMPAEVGGDYTITATCTDCSDDTVARLEHVTFGDVWYCAGQSNMALPLEHSYSRNASRDAVLAGRYTNIRIHGLSGNMNPAQPWATLKQALAESGDSRQLGDAQDGRGGSSGLMGFSASCFYFAQELSDKLGEAAPPIGLVHTAWGGSTIEQWLTTEAIATCKYVKPAADHQEWHDSRVLPYVSMTLKGFLWYQGENNCHSTMGNSASKAGYSCLMEALVAQWRSLWSATAGTTDPSAPFGIVTLASSGSEGASGLAMGAMRHAQTGGFGVLPPPHGAAAGGMANTFLAQAYDLDDEWSGDRGPCLAISWNQSSPLHACCDNHGFNKDKSSCPTTWQAKCANMCAANAGTSQYMGGIHPRSKIYVGQRLAQAAFNTAYGGKGSFTGPTLAGCALTTTSLTINFDTKMLRGDTVLLQKYSAPNFVPYYHGHGNPGWHGGSQIYVQTEASSFCIETQHVNESDQSSDVYCPTWSGGAGDGITQAAPSGRFPTFGGNGATTSNNASEFNMGWINLPVAAGPTSSSITVDLRPLKGAAPTAVRYAWGIIDCCDLTDSTTFTSKPCIANCPIMGSTGLPANPFIAKISGGKCECVAPQDCSLDTSQVLQV